MHRAHHLIAVAAPPRAVAALYAGAAEGDLEAATACFASDALYVFGADDADERGGRVVARGPDEIADALGVDLAVGARGRLCARRTRVPRQGSSRRRRPTGGDVCGVVPARRGRLGAPRRHVPDDARVCGAVLARGAVGGRRGRGARARAQYFTRLEAGDVAGAAACFSENVLYAYPQTEPGRPRPVHVGRHRVLEAFVERGTRPWRHRVLTSIQHGRSCIAERDVTGLPAGRSGGWISSLTLDADGLIERYRAFYAEPGPPPRRVRSSNVRATLRWRIVN